MALGDPDSTPCYLGGQRASGSSRLDRHGKLARQIHMELLLHSMIGNATFSPARRVRMEDEVGVRPANGERRAQTRPWIGDAPPLAAPMV